MGTELARSGGDLVEAAPARPLPANSRSGAVELGREVAPVALAATAGVAAGVVAVVAAAQAAGAVRRVPRRRGIGRFRRQKVVASRSFLVDLHILGR